MKITEAYTENNGPTLYSLSPGDVFQFKYVAGTFLMIDPWGTAPAVCDLADCKLHCRDHYGPDKEVILLDAELILRKPQP